MLTRRAVMYSLSFIAAAVAAVFAGHVTASWTWATGCFVGIVLLGALLTVLAELAHKKSEDPNPNPNEQHESKSVMSSGPGSIAVGGNNYGSINVGRHGRQPIEAEQGSGEREASDSEGASVDRPER